MSRWTSMWSVQLALLLLLNRRAVCNSILGVAAIGARSHFMNVLRLGRELTDRGHTFGIILSDVDTINAETVRAQTFSGLQVLTFKGPPGLGTETGAAQPSRDPQETVAKFLQDQKDTARYLYADKAALSQIEQAGFDLLVTDVTTWPGAMLAEHLRLPRIDFMPVPCVTAAFEELSVPNPIAYIPQFGLSYTPNMSFRQRVHNFIHYFLLKSLVRMISNDQAAFAKETGLRLPFQERGKVNSAASITVTDFAIEYPLPMPPRMHMVGPLLADDAKPLPADMADFLDWGLSHGHPALYVSMGTWARLTKQELFAMGAALSALPNPVLWKLDPLHMPGNMTIADLKLARNIRTTAWASQNDVLGHPSVKAFIMQGGINSLYEAAYHAKPVVSIPLGADQVDNAAKAVWHGFGRTITADDMVLTHGKALQQAVLSILKDPTFTTNAVKVQKRLISKPRKPVQVAADVVERVLATGGEMYLETHEQHLYWWQLSLLDVKLFLASIAVLAMVLITTLTWFSGKFLFSQLCAVSGIASKQKLKSR